jgi:hypothetical protein
MEVNPDLTMNLVLSERFLPPMVGVILTMEFEKSDHVYLHVTNTKEVILLLFGWYTRNVSKMHDDFVVFIIVLVTCFLRSPLPS